MPIEAFPSNRTYDPLESPSGVHDRTALLSHRRPYDAFSDPFNAVASDFDGVVSDHANPEVAERMRKMVIERTLAKGVPLSFITGKEESDAFAEIVEPYRRAIAEMGIPLSANQFMVYSNNGSVTIDVGLEGQVLERKEFSIDDKLNILESETVKTLLEIFRIVKDCRDKVGSQLDANANRLQNLDSSTICFRIDPENLMASPVELPILVLLKEITGKSNPTRFDIAAKMREEFATMGIEAEISSTDRSIDITPKGSGKRGALEDFSRRTNVPIDDTLRIDDSPTGMGYGLLMAVDGEKRGGFTNVAIAKDELRAVQSNPAFAGTRAPIEVTFMADQFANAEFVFRSVKIEAMGRSSGVWTISR